MDDSSATQPDASTVHRLHAIDPDPGVKSPADSTPEPASDRRTIELEESPTVIRMSDLKVAEIRGSGPVEAGLKGVIAELPNTGLPGNAGVQTPASLTRNLEGRSLNHFELVEQIGGGGMGAVFRARDARLGRTVAVKVIPFAGGDPELQRRFRNEAQSAAKLDHPMIARVFEVGNDGPWHYIVFEYIDGQNIRDIVEAQGPLSIDDAVFYACQLAEAIGHASRRGIVHRDVKPSNVIVTAEGPIKLVDMGLARSDSFEASEDLTASGVTLGTFDYISPEQARDPRLADLRSDLYSLGCTLYFMLTGSPPFPGGTMLQKLLAHGNAAIPDVRGLRPEASADLTSILRKMLAKGPEQRYQRTSDLVADLVELATRENLKRSRGVAVVATGEIADAFAGVRRHLPWMVAAGLLLVSAGWLELMAWQTRRDFNQNVASSVSSGALESLPPRSILVPQPRPAGDVGPPRVPGSDDNWTARPSESASTGTQENVPRPLVGVRPAETIPTPASELGNLGPLPAVPPSGSSPQQPMTAVPGPTGTGPTGTGPNPEATQAAAFDSVSGLKAIVPSMNGLASDPPSLQGLPLPATGESSSRAIVAAPAQPLGDRSLPESPSRSIDLTATGTDLTTPESPMPGSPLAGSPLAGSPLAGSPLTSSTQTSSPLPGSPLPGSPLPDEMLAWLGTRRNEKDLATFMAPDLVRIVGRAAIGSPDVQNQAQLDRAILVDSLSEALSRCETLSLDRIEIATPLLVSDPVTLGRSDLILSSTTPGGTAIVFRSADEIDMVRSDMCVIGKNRVEFADLHFYWTVPPTETDGGAMFSLAENRRVRMTNCSITIDNPSRREAVHAFHISAASQPKTPEPLSDRGSRTTSASAETTTLRETMPTLPLVSIELKNVIVRGQISLMKMDSAAGLQFLWENGLLAVSRRLLETGGSAWRPRATSGSIQLSLFKLTARAPEGLIRMPIDATHPFPVVIEWRAEESVFVVDRGSPYVEIDGLNRSDRADAWLKWRGLGNAYETDASLADVLLVSRDDFGQAQLVTMNDLISDGVPTWADDRSPRWVIRWSQPLPTATPTSRLLPADFRQDGSLVGGFTERDLPRMPMERSFDFAPPQ